MEDEKKIEEVKKEEVKTEEKTSLVKILSEKIKMLREKVCKCKENCNCKEKCCAIWKNDKKRVIIAAIALVAVIAIVVGGLAFKAYWKKIDVGPKAVKEKVETFVKNNAPAGAKFEVKDVVKEGDLYKLTISANGQEVPLYVTRDGKKLIQQPIELDQNSDTQNADAQAAKKTEAEQKNDMPTVDLFVMSYCPYGLQSEKGILPAVETLGNKIKFNLKFVDYTLHGQKEVDENLNQYCIGKNQPEKLGAYLKCFWKKSTNTAAICMKTVGVNALQVKSCVTEAKNEFSPTEKSIGINKEENTSLDVQGSPTLVVNGTTISANRDSASMLKAICSGFAVQPKECSTKLSTVIPSAGFDDQTATGVSSSGAACAQ